MLETSFKFAVPPKLMRSWFMVNWPCDLLRPTLFSLVLFRGYKIVTLNAYMFLLIFPSHMNAEDLCSTWPCCCWHTGSAWACIGGCCCWNVVQQIAFQQFRINLKPTFTSAPAVGFDYVRGPLDQNLPLLKLFTKKKVHTDSPGRWRGGCPLRQVMLNCSVSRI